MLVLILGNMVFFSLRPVENVDISLLTDYTRGDMSRSKVRLFAFYKIATVCSLYRVQIKKLLFSKKFIIWWAL